MRVVQPAVLVWAAIVMSSMLMSIAVAQPATNAIRATGVSDNLSSLLTVLQSFSKMAEASSASDGETCSSTTLNQNYGLCEAELDAEPTVCGTNCQSALQYLTNNCDALIRTYTVDAQQCILFENPGAASGTIVPIPISAASTTFAKVAVVIAATAAAVAFVLV